jgi:hypothetical protein
MKTAITIKMMPTVRLYLRTYQSVLLLGVCIISLVCGGYAAPTRNPTKDESWQISETDSNGPTMIMSYSKEKFNKNPIASFMYFVPLIAPTFVDNISSVNNEQQVGIISHKIKVNSKSFHVICEFEVLGSGFHMNTFDPAGMIAAHTDELKKGETLTNMLDYIKFDGDGYGIIEVKGRITGSAKTVTEVSMQFNARGHKSPVTIGLYDVKPKDGEYKYENRSNQIVARVNTLVFEKTEQTPRMGIKVASIAKEGKPAGFFGIIKGAIANLFIKPPKVDKLGNTTMLEFGDALLQKKPAFTFPKAENIKESNIVEVYPIQK